MVWCLQGAGIKKKNPKNLTILVSRVKEKKLQRLFKP